MRGVDVSGTHSAAGARFHPNGTTHLKQRRPTDRKNPLFTTAEITKKSFAKMSSIERKKKTNKKKQHKPEYHRSSSTLETSRLGAFDFETTNIGAVIYSHFLKRVEEVLLVNRQYRTTTA